VLPLNVYRSHELNQRLTARYRLRQAGVAAIHRLAYLCLGDFEAAI
jgi:hypothetical protein